MLSHLCIGTNDFPRAYAFYTALLGELDLVEKFHDGAASAVRARCAT